MRGGIEHERERGAPRSLDAGERWMMRRVSTFTAVAVSFALLSLALWWLSVRAETRRGELLEQTAWCKAERIAKRALADGPRASERVRAKLPPEDTVSARPEDVLQVFEAGVEIVYRAAVGLRGRSAEQAHCAAGCVEHHRVHRARRWPRRAARRVLRPRASVRRSASERACLHSGGTAHPVHRSGVRRVHSARRHRPSVRSSPGVRPDRGGAASALALFRLVPGARHRRATRRSGQDRAAPGVRGSIRTPPRRIARRGCRGHRVAAGTQPVADRSLRRPNRAGRRVRPRLRGE